MRRLIILVASVVGVSVAAWSVPSVRARVKATGVLTEIAGIGVPRPWAASVDVKTTAIEGVEGDMYSGGDDAPVVLFVPGATRSGRGDERVVEAATALARAGRRVFVPELTLYDRRFARADIDRLVTAIDALSGDAQIGVLAFSYGGSLSLIAAADPLVADKVAYIATFGAYFDLANVIRGVTVGSTRLDGAEVPFETVPEARTILTSAAARLASGGQVEELRDALETSDPGDLTSHAHAIYDLLTNEDPGQTDRLLAAMPPRFKDILEQLSPSGYMDDVAVPVFVMQSKKDAATPWTEAVLLERAAPRARLVMLEHFSHVDKPGIAGWARDGIEAWRFTSWALEAQE